MRGPRGLAVLPVVALLVAGCGSPAATFPEAPAIAIADLDGNVHSLADQRGKAVLVNVWATWCKPCGHELPLIEEVYREYAPRGLTVWAVSIDDRYGGSSVREYADALNLTILVLHDPDGQTVTPALRNAGAPDTFVIDAEGRIVDRFEGAWDPRLPENRARIEAALPG